VVSLADGWVALYVADAAGHGVAAAMLSVLFKNNLQMYDGNGSILSPAQVLSKAGRNIPAGCR
jgi:serine phosphatase RsbU (regulator of sigma subunit)